MWENTTSQVSSEIDDARSARATVRTRMPDCCRKGKTIDEKSPSTLSTSAPSGTPAATRLAITEVCEPVATRCGLTPTNRAYDRRVRSTMPS